MMYKTIVLDAGPKARPLAAAVEAKANEMAIQGFFLVTMSITASGKAILVFQTEACHEENCQNVTETAAESETEAEEAETETAAAEQEAAME